MPPIAAKGFELGLAVFGLGPQGFGRAVELGATGAGLGFAGAEVAAEEAAAASAEACIIGSCTSSYILRRALNPPG